MLVEEVPKTSSSNSSTIYFTSSINLSARSVHRGGATGDEDSVGSNKKGRAKVNYNVNLLMNAQTQINDESNTGPLKSAQQVQLERLVSRRLVELNKESATASFEIPKNFAYNSIHSNSNKSRLGQTPTTKRILAARRNLNSYFEEERNLMSINTILGVNFQFIDFAEVEAAPKIKRAKVDKIYRPRLRLCCICGSQSHYSRCSNCGLYYCSVQCNNIHMESRCT
ncbi:putative BBOX Zn-finger protein [Scheffersomyces stipitis CBS 6054]|uniref:Predicted BBOX Zn-finger protein n=1 Tax=Scheffersomyces stipitis (strain ATCC 58785 / CBS 6054 / NBRC 10063 / NRRL Y-11545) TaxID=322104 RepID=A3GG81_PICST|nr:Predicted BBOX Zn-finger protein [Scheffersomyces stipitis CBS 6054]EAZ63890.2 putative BBOX Zn-finger protein [Scheffersomyces stipitis CBS 6054]